MTTKLPATYLPIRSYRMNWTDDWNEAPKDGKTKILLLLPTGDITTGCFYWYTESDYESFSAQIGYWSLYDTVRDEPLDEAGPIEQSSIKWAPFP